MSDKSFRPNFYIYNKQTLGSHIKMALRHSAGRMVYRIKSVKENDPLGFHYRSTLRSTTKLKLINYRSNFIFDKDWKAKLKKTTKSILFMPLHSTPPETTVEYWLVGKDMIAYEARVLQQVEQLSKKIQSSD